MITLNSKENNQCESGNGNSGYSCGCGCEEGVLADINQNTKYEHTIDKTPLITLAIGGIIFLIGLFIQITFPSTVIATIPIGNNLINIELPQIILLLIVPIVGHNIIKNGILSLIKGHITINLLVIIATIGAFLLGEVFEGALLILLFFLAEYLEDYALDKSKHSISQLLNLTPELAIKKEVKKELKDKVEDGIKEELELEQDIIKNTQENLIEIIEEHQVPVESLKIGDIVIVKPGEKIPIDGIVVSGETFVNQSSITGESLAVVKKVNDEVYGSTINEDGYIEVEVTKDSKDTVISKIIQLVKESENKKAKIDLFINKFAKYYTPLVIGLAIIVATVPSFIFGLPLSEWIHRSLVLLVVSCPCALALSTPISMVSAITSGTKKGILIKGGEYIEEINKVKAVLFDKTGTLTEGNLEINEIIPIEYVSKKISNNSDNESEEEEEEEVIKTAKISEIAKIASSLESKSKHPIANAFTKYCETNKINLEAVQSFESITGNGLKGTINQTEYYIGKKELFKEIGITDLEILMDKIEISNNLGKTEIILGTNDKIIGIITLKDKIREEAKEIITQLKKKDIKTIMVTGDNESTAKTVANEIGIDKYYFNLLPNDKVDILSKSKEKYGTVAMIGDGVNDSPSLALADVGIVMGMSGSGIAVETGDIVLLEDNLSKIDTLLQISKKTMAVIKENLSVSIIVKSSLTILAIYGLIDLWEAVLIGDMGLTLLVIANALRIGR
ncbi:MAG: heavy metal translocating P-type ATPase [Methanobacteriaceae archaeon]